MTSEFKPFEVLIVAWLLHDRDMAHPSNKNIEQFIPKAVELLQKAHDYYCLTPPPKTK
jgi:hypothetical protein